MKHGVSQSGVNTQAASTAPNPPQARHQIQPSAISATPATQSGGVAKCHACHAKRRSMSPSATPATQTAVCGQVACVDVCEEVVCEEVV